MEVLAGEDERTLRRAQLPNQADGSFEQRPLEWAAGGLPTSRQLVEPTVGNVGEPTKVIRRLLPEPREKPGDDVTGGIVVDLEQRRARLAALQEHGVPLCVPVEQADSAVAGPGAKRVRLVFRFLVGRADLQNDVAGRQHERHVPACEGRSERQSPLLSALLGKTLEVYFSSALIFRAIVRASPRTSSVATLPFAPAA